MAEKCQDCRLWKTSSVNNGAYSCNKMMGVGNPRASVMFVDTYPGDDEVKSKVPFSGISGQTLQKYMRAVGFTAGQAYYTYLNKCKPNYTELPTKVERTACLKYLLDEIRAVRPQVVVTMGVDVTATFGIKGAITTTTHGKTFDYEVESPDGNFKVKVIPIYSPSYLKNFFEKARQWQEFSQDLATVLKVSKGSEETPVLVADYKVAKTVQEVIEIVDTLLKAEWVTYDCETTGLSYTGDKILITSFSDGPGKGYVIPYQYPGIFNEQEQIIVKEQLSRILGSSVKKIMQNGKFDLQFLFANNIPIKSFVFDTMLAHYLLDENSRHGLDSIVPIYTDMGSYKENIGDYFAGRNRVLIEGYTCEAVGLEKVYKDPGGNTVSESKAHRVATILDCSYADFTEYAAKDADATFRLFKAFWPLLEKEDLLKLLIQIVTPLSFVLANMEFTGIKGDLNYVQSASAKYKAEMLTLKESISNSPQIKKYLEKYNNGKKVTKTGVKKVGFDGESVLNYLREKKLLTAENLVVQSFDGLDEEFQSTFPGTAEQYEALEDLLYESTGQFNMNSPTQKSRLFFDIMGLVPQKFNRVTDKQRLKGKTGFGNQGTPSTDSESLELLLKGNKIKLLEDIINYQKVRKFQDYMLSYEKLLQASHDGRIHTSYSQHTTKTGRLSSSAPNLQNIPKQDEKRAKVIRTTFVAREGYSFIEVDYSQIEFRIWGHCSEDEKLLAALNNENVDIHYQVASKILKIPIEKVTKEQRTAAKGVTFGLMYGMSNYSLAKSYNMDEGEVNRFVTGFFSSFPVASQWMEKNVDKMEKQGFISNWAGRRRRSTDIYSKIPELKAGAQRQARNSPVQSGAADLIYVAMIKLFRMLQQYGDDAKMLLQIHDSLTFEVKDSLMLEVLPKIKGCMESAVPMKCRTTVAAEIGKNLGDMKEVRLNNGNIEVLVKKTDSGEKIWAGVPIYNKIEEREVICH